MHAALCSSSTYSHPRALLRPSLPVVAADKGILGPDRVKIYKTSLAYTATEAPLQRSLHNLSGVDVWRWPTHALHPNGNEFAKRLGFKSRTRVTATLPPIQPSLSSRVLSWLQLGPLLPREPRELVAYFTGLTRRALKVERLERPQLLFDGNMRPQYAFVAAMANGSSVNLAIPLIGSKKWMPHGTSMLGETYTPAAVSGHLHRLKMEHNLTELPPHALSWPWAACRLPWSCSSDSGSAGAARFSLEGEGSHMHSRM